MTKASAYKIVFMSLLIGLFYTGLPINASNAAPQALALVNSNGEVALQCDDGECVATLSSYCLQKSRSMPATGTAYEFADVGQVRLVGVRTDGSRVVLEASNELRLFALRRQIAVRITIPKARLDALGLKHATIEVGPNVTLLPKAVAGDTNPLSKGEVALATGPLRELGTRLVESDSSRIKAARYVLRLSDALPRTAALAPKAREQFLDRARSGEASATLSSMARDQARDFLNVCQVQIDVGAFNNLRQCLEQRHDSLLRRFNVDYWQSIDQGS